MIIAVVAKCVRRIHKVPVWEQMPRCAVMAMQMAAVATRLLNGIPSTGPLDCFLPAVRDGLQLRRAQSKIAASYLGTPSLKPPAPLARWTPRLRQLFRITRAKLFDSEHLPQNSDSHTYSLRMSATIARLH